MTRDDGDGEGQADAGTVLVTDGQVRSALAVVRSLGRRGVRVTVGDDTRLSTAAFSKYAADWTYHPPPDRDPDGFLAATLNHVATHDVDALLPVSHHATRVVCDNRDAYRRHTAVPVPPAEVFDAAWDKARTMDAAARADVPHPRTICPSSVEEALDRVASFEFPVVVKPRTGSGSRGLRVVESPADFEAAFRASHADEPRPLVQECIPRHGPGIGTGFLFDRDGDVRARFAYRRLREYPPDGGPSTLRESVDRADVLRYGERLLRELDWRGVAMVEFKLDPRDDVPKLMEVNPRFWGSLHLPYYAGVDFPWLVYRHALGAVPETVDGYRAGVRCRFLLPGDLLYLASRRDREALREFLPLSAPELYYDVLDRDDPAATVGRLLGMARNAVRPRMWRTVVFR